MRLAGRVVAIGLLVVAAGLATVAITARFRDGPFGPFPGGALERGPLVHGALPDPETIARVNDVELQLREPRRSHLTWIVEHEGDLYVSCGSVGVPFLTRWPRQAVVDGRSTLRILGRRYEGRLVRVTGTELYRVTSEKVIDKYGAGFSADPDDLWIFRFDPALPEDNGSTDPTIATDS